MDIHIDICCMYACVCIYIYVYIYIFCLAPLLTILAMSLYNIVGGRLVMNDSQSLGSFLAMLSIIKKIGSSTGEVLWVLLAPHS